MTKLGVWYDFRNPLEMKLPWPDLYEGLLDQAVMAEQVGFDSIWVSEHHFLEEGYLPSLAPMLAVLADRTSSIKLGTAVLLAPLHHPLRVAEDMAFVDQLSRGRLELGIAPGYRPEEFKVMGIPKAQRGRRTDETIELLQLAWAGKRFSYHSEHFDFHDVIVAPPPFTEGGPPLWIGGSSMFSALRAAKYGCGFMPDSGAGREIYNAYQENYRGPSKPRLATNRVIFAAASKDEAWALAGESLLFQFNGYRKWFADADDADTHGGALTDYHELSTSHYFVGTPDEITESILSAEKEFGFEELIFWARPPGMALDVSTKSLELIAREVLPAVATSRGQ
jgi:alkanesulfonate monooxygenase SsuD/methylene tetrahydromethanopterin reductase-like flavin-dependent oxidoreductase (luciferase family)